MNRSYSVRLIVLECFLLAAPCSALVGEGYDLIWNTLNGGGDKSSNGDLTLTGTIGQPEASAADALTGGLYSLTGGFWGVVLPACTTFAAADFDHDCDVDGDDFNAFKTCASRSGVPPGPGCATGDLDHDGDVDMDDFGIFQRCYSGAANPPPAGCGH